jgi:hypothetical protein
VTEAPTQQRSLWLVAVVVIVALVVVYARIVVGGSTWDDAQYHTEVVPPRLAAAEAVRAGSAPAWWDGSGFGVPLLAEPTHGALAPGLWAAHDTHSMDLSMLAYLAWAALGVAVWSRTRSRLGAAAEASDHAAVTAALLVGTSGLLASTALRGALPGLAHLPWIGAVCARMMIADRASPRARLAAALAILVGLIAISGELGVLIDALALVVALCVRRTDRPGPTPFLLLAVVAGLLIGALLWLPAIIHVPSSAGSQVHAMPLARLLELVAPGSFGASDPAHGVAALAGASPWAPSLFVGAPLLSLAAVRIPTVRMRLLLAFLVVLVLVAGRSAGHGGFPAWLGPPELHLAALVVILGANAAGGIDALLAGQRRAVLALAVGTACVLIALGALAIWRTGHPETVTPIDHAVLNGGIGFLCSGLALVLARQNAKRMMPLVLALLVLPNAGALGVTAPTIDRETVERTPVFAAGAAKDAWSFATMEIVELSRSKNGSLEPKDSPARISDLQATYELRSTHTTLKEQLAEIAGAPLRVFRPPVMLDGPPTRERMQEAASRDPSGPDEVMLVDSIETLDNSASSLFGFATARSKDPARPRITDQAWLAAAHEGGALLDRFGIRLAILPATMVDGAHSAFFELARRNDWALVTLPVAPIASVMQSWLWMPNPADALAALYQPGGGTLPRGQLVLAGTGPEGEKPGLAEPCTIDRWSPGAIDLTCNSFIGGYAVITSSSAPGWSVAIDGVDQPWVTADVLRRGVKIGDGKHALAWRYAPPLWTLARVLALLGVLIALALLVRSRRS